MTEETTPKDVTLEVAESQNQTEATPEVSLQETNKALTDRLKQLEDNWKNSDRVNTKKEQEIQRLKEQLENNESQANITKALIAMMAERQGRDSDDVESEVKQKQPNLLAQFEKLQKEQETKKAYAKITALQRRTESLGLKPEDDEYVIIKSLATEGKYDKVESRLEKLEQAKQVVVTPVKDEKKEEKKDVAITDEDKEKIALEYMKTKGLIKEGLKPSGTGKIPNLADINKFTPKELNSFLKEKKANSVYELMRRGEVKEK